MQIISYLIVQNNIIIYRKRDFLHSIDLCTCFTIFSCAFITNLSLYARYKSYLHKDIAYLAFFRVQNFKFSKLIIVEIKVWFVSIVTRKLTPLQFLL